MGEEAHATWWGQKGNRSESLKAALEFSFPQRGEAFRGLNGEDGLTFWNIALVAVLAISHGGADHMKDQLGHSRGKMRNSADTYFGDLNTGQTKLPHNEMRKWEEFGAWGSWDFKHSVINNNSFSLFKSPRNWEVLRVAVGQPGCQAWSCAARSVAQIAPPLLQRTLCGLGQWAGTPQVQADIGHRKLPPPAARGSPVTVTLTREKIEVLHLLLLPISLFK